MSRIALLLMLAAGAGGAQCHAATGAGTARIVLPDTVTPIHYDIEATPDAAAATFTAVVRIALVLHHSTRDIELNSANLAFSRVRLSGNPAEPTISFDGEQQTATLHFPTPVKSGRHILSIHYSGVINPSAAGLFYLDYDSSTGRKRALYTQFENSDARRFFPCWDEPNRKATFTLKVIAPAESMAVSNMPAARICKLAGGRVRTRFQTTPKMSTYLLFLGLGDFERVTRKVNGVELGVVFKRGDAAKARFALDAAAQLLPYYEDYFSVRYPLPKLDLVSGPGQSQLFGAMENWGAIFGFDNPLLVDPLIATQADRIRTYVDIAHEMAHQWFGNLVTMDWWDDLWLNEGFAEWMQYKATAHFHPDWQPWLSAALGREDAMKMDSRAGTHPVITPIADVLQANNAFDTITYQKGMSVVRMLEQQVGEIAFRDGIRRYLRKFAYGNAVTEDLWRELDQTAPHPVADIAHEFTLQSGVPLIRVSAAAGVHLEQERYATDASSASTAWHVPVIAQSPSGKEWRGIVTADAPADLPQAPAEGIVVNAGQSGYFRTLYSPELIASLSARFGSLHAADQLGTLLDAEALGLAGYEPLPDVLRLAQQIGPGSQPQVQREVAGMLRSIAGRYRDRAGSAAFRAYAMPMLERMYADSGWNTRAGDSADVNLLRATVIEALSDLDDAAVTSRARELFGEYVRDPGSLQAELRELVLSVAAVHADAALWEQIHSLARNARSAAEKQEYYGILGLARDPRLAQQTLELTLTDEIETTTRPQVLKSVAQWYPELAFEFAVAHRDQVNSWVEPADRDLYQTTLLGTSVDPGALDRLKGYAESHIQASDRGPAEAVEALIVYNIKVRTEQLPLIDAWLKR